MRPLPACSFCVSILFSHARALVAVDVYLAVGDSYSQVSNCTFLAAQSWGRTGRGLLLAEALHGLRGHFGRLWLVRAKWWVGGLLTFTNEAVEDAMLASDREIECVGASG